MSKIKKTNDPAFMFYPKDWLTGTADLMPDEKGVYIDLLCYQHQHLILPKDTLRLSRLVALPHDEFLRIWERIEDNFIPKDGGFINLKLYNLMDNRAVNAKKKRISGAFALCLRQNDLTKEQTSAIKKDFRNEDFLEFTEDAIMDEVKFWMTKWLTKR